MDDISKFLKIMDEAQDSVDGMPSHYEDNRFSDVRKHIDLVEGKLPLDESFKDARAKFTKEEDVEVVKQYLDTFKDLAKRNIIKGEDKDISSWIKGGWQPFKEFVDQSSEKTSKRQEKEEKKSDSITVYEDDDKMVVIPLTHDASCFYGANTQWCTTSKDNDSHFNQYFGDNGITLFYILPKIGSEKVAVAYSHEVESFEVFDEEDDSVSIVYVEDKFNLHEEDFERWYEEHSERIEGERPTPLSRLRKNVELYKNDDMKGYVVLEPVDDIDLDDGIDILYTKLGFTVDFEQIILDDHSHLIEYIDGDTIIDADVYKDEIEPTDDLEYVNPEYREALMKKILKDHSDLVASIVDVEEEELSLSDVMDSLDELLELPEMDDLMNAFLSAKRMSRESSTMSSIYKKLNDGVCDVLSELGMNDYISSNTLHKILDSEVSYALPINVDDVVMVVEALIDEGSDLELSVSDIGIEDDDKLYGQILEEELVDYIS